MSTHNICLYGEIKKKKIFLIALLIWSYDRVGILIRIASTMRFNMFLSRSNKNYFLNNPMSRARFTIISETYLFTLNIGTGMRKWCRPRSDATECSVCLDSMLFATHLAHY